MPDEIILILKVRVKANAKEEIKQELEDLVEDFLDSSVATREGDIEEQNV